jgi:hypothetical protein
VILLLLSSLLYASSPEAEAPMDKAECLRAADHMFGLMKTDPEWMADAGDRAAQMAEEQKSMRAMCDKPTGADDAAMLRCVAEATKLPGVKLCVAAAKEAQDEARSQPIAAPPPMILPPTAAVSQQTCLKVQVHISEVMRANPAISPDERSALSAMREAFGAEADQDSCKKPIPPSAQDLLRCQGGTTTVPGLEACEAEAVRQKTERLGPLLQRAVANTERLRSLLLAQQAAGQALIAFQATPATIPPDELAVEALPDGPGKPMLTELGLSTLHCTYAVHTHQYNYRTKNNDGPPLPGGFALVTRCDLDSDGVAAHIGADAKNPAKLQTLPRVF